MNEEQLNKLNKYVDAVIMAATNCRYVELKSGDLKKRKEELMDACYDVAGLLTMLRDKLHTADILVGEITRMTEALRRSAGDQATTELLKKAGVV